MAITQADVDALERAVVNATLTVEYDGRRVTYRSMAELLSALNYAKSQLLSQAAVTAASQSLVIFERD